MTTPFPFTAGQTLTAAQMNAITELVINDKTDSYTLVAGDAGEYVIMNKATATTLTVPNSVFTAGQIVRIVNKGAGVCTVTAGAGTTVSSTGTLALAQYATGTLIALSASAFIFEAGGVTASPGALAVVKAETSFSAASSVTADSVFTSTYTNYLVSVTYSTSTTNQPSFKLRTGGSSASTNYDVQTLSANDTGVSGARLTAQTSALFGFYTNSASEKYGVNIWLNGPQLAQATAFHSEASGTVGSNLALSYYVGGNHRTATAYDGIELLVASGNMTGTYAIYGYAKS